MIRLKKHKLMKNLFYLLSLSIFISCSSNEANDVSEEVEKFSADNKTITLTQDQIDVAGIKTETIGKMKISETVECTGTIEVSPENIASVSPIINGFVKSLNYNPGDYVKKGDALATFQHPDFIQLQQQYLEAKSQVDYYQEEFKRQGELTVENAASIKKMQKAKSEYLSYEANYKSLKAQLELLGVNISKIEKEDFDKEFKMFAPINGTISRLNTNLGRFANPETPVYEIINDENLFLQLNIFEKDLPKIAIGQKVIFKILNDQSEYVAKVKRIGIGIDKTNRTTIVQCISEKKSNKIKPGKFINASILINERDAYTLPSEAIVSFNSEPHVFIKSNNNFNLIKTKAGIEQNNMVEILEADNNLLKAEIVVIGTYYLSTILQAEE